MNWYTVDADKKQIAAEREKAKKLRKTAWWQAKVNSGLCEYCGLKFRPQELTMDHVVPLARGGKSTKGNIVASCKECNNKKKLDTPVDQILKKKSE